MLCLCFPPCPIRAGRRGAQVEGREGERSRDVSSSQNETSISTPQTRGAEQQQENGSAGGEYARIWERRIAALDKLAAAKKELEALDREADQCLAAKAE